MTARVQWRAAAVGAATAVAYFAAAKLGLQLAFVNASATAVWPPTGIAIAAFLILGRRAAPGIWAGAFLANVTTQGGLLVAAAIATGNMLEGWLGAGLTWRFAGGTEAFARPQGLIVFAGLAGLGAALVSATIGVTALMLGGVARWAEVGPIWTTWWLGDASGALLFAPLIVLWSAGGREGWTRARAIESAALAAVILLDAGLVFGGWFPRVFRSAPPGLTIFPILLWAGYRLGSREASAATVIMSLFAIVGTLRGLGPFGAMPPEYALVFLQAFLAVTGLTALLVAALAAGQRHALSRAVEGHERQTLVLDSVLDGIGEGVMVVGSDEDFLRMNDAARRILGLTRPEREYSMEEIRKLYRAKYQADGTPYPEASLPTRRALGGQLVIEEEAHLVPPGRAAGVWVRVSARPLKAADGSTSGAVVVLRDVTAAHEAEEELKRRTEMNEALLTAQNELGEGVAIIDVATQRFLRVNAALCGMYGYAEADMLALPSMWSLVPPEDLPALQSRLRERAAGRPQADHYELNVLHRTGRRLSVEVAVRTVDTRAGKWIVSLIRDVTERKRAEELQKDKEIAEASNRAKSDFLATVSHELRTPLTAIIGFANLLMKQRGLSPDDDRRYLERIRENGRELLEDINDLLDLAKIEAGRMAVLAAPVDLGPFLAELAASFEFAARDKGLRIAAEVAPGLPPVVTDGAKLRRILTNLMANAVKFTERGSVTVRAWEHDGAVAIQVADTGIGVPPDKLGMIFDAFQQVDEGRARRYGGTGLGLAICRSLKDLLGATLDVESEPGAGTTFTLILPPHASAPVAAMAANGGQRHG